MQGAIRAPPQQIEAVAILVDNAAKQLHALSQSIVRPDLDQSDMLPTARNAAARLAKDSLAQLEMLPEPKGKAKK